MQPEAKGTAPPRPVAKDGLTNRAFWVIYAIQFICVVIGAVLLVVGHKSLPNAYGYAAIPFVLIAAGIKISVDVRSLSGWRRSRKTDRPE